MADVKSSIRTLKLFEAFGEQRGAMSLSQIANHLEMPTSSCLQLIRTLVANGYLFGTGRRQQYYPTRRLYEVTSKIARQDPVMDRVQPYLDDIRDLTGETVAFSTLQGDRVIILGVAESPKMLRVTIPVGTVRPPHVMASGKSLLASLQPKDRRQLLQRLDMRPFTPLTVTSAEDLEADIEAGLRRGYQRGFGEGLLEMGTIALPAMVDGETYSISVSGPSARIEAEESKIVETVRGVADRMTAELSVS